jgi:hypothetical protein
VFSYSKAIITAFRPSPSLSLAAPTGAHEDFLMRFHGFTGLVCALAVQICAARLRALDPTLLFESRAQSFARRHLERVLEVR